MVSWTSLIGRSVSQTHCLLAGILFVALLTIVHFPRASDGDGGGAAVEQTVGEPCFELPRKLSQEMDKRLASLAEQIGRLEFLDREKTKMLLKMRASSKSRGGARTPSADAAIVYEPNHVNMMPSNVSGLLLNTSLESSAPSIYDFMPHLLQLADAAGDISVALRPSLRLGTTVNQSNRRDFVIGIPTVPREKQSYLLTTVRSLIDNLSTEDRTKVVIIVLLADLKGASSTFVQTTSVTLASEFAYEMKEGLLEVIAPPPLFYPADLKTVKPTFGDSQDRMFWRTKQNLDYAYLWMYCQQRGRYYLQIEDDVITKPSYIESIRLFIDKHVSDEWLALEFSSLGFIGKLFRTSDLPLFVQFIVMFYRHKPVDWLLHHVFWVRYCSPEKPGKECNKLIRQHWFLHKPSLFQHIGVHSSLKGKVQKLKEKDFGKSGLNRPHLDNPLANISTSLKTYQKFDLNKCYAGTTYFWSLNPQPGDYIRFDFSPPIRLSGVTIKTGNAEHPADKIGNASVSIRPINDEPPAAGDSLAQSPQTVNDDKERWIRLGEFQPSGTLMVDLTTDLLTQSLKVTVHSESENWLIISEIHLRNKKV